jgi:hypothetical protein
MNALKQQFVDFAKARANESKGTPYEWDFNTLYPTEKDVEYFFAVVEGHPKYDWKTNEHWDDIIDWFEDLPVY